jgi:hypothetical protein
MLTEAVPSGSPVSRGNAMVADAKTRDKIDIGRIVWRQPDGTLVSCVDKLKVLNENLEEIRQVCQDAFEDAVLMGCDERQVREVLDAIVGGLENPYRQR